MTRSVNYKGLALMSGSEAYLLASQRPEGWEKKLKEHLANLDAKHKELLASATLKEKATHDRHGCSRQS